MHKACEFCSAHFRTMSSRARYCRKCVIERRQTYAQKYWRETLGPRVADKVAEIVAQFDATPLDEHASLAHDILALSDLDNTTAMAVGRPEVDAILSRHIAT